MGDSFRSEGPTITVLEQLASATSDGDLTDVIRRASTSIKLAKALAAFVERYPPAAFSGTLVRTMSDTTSPWEREAARLHAELAELRERVSKLEASATHSGHDKP